jgi:hypothetical protein
VALTGSCTSTDPEKEASVADDKALRTIAKGFGLLTFAVTLVAIFVTINFPVP